MTAANPAKLILFFTRTDSGGTDQVWFYDMQADGYSLDDKRTPLNGAGPNPHANNNLPDIWARWQKRAAAADRQRSEQSFLVPKAEIAGNDYDLSINRYKQIVYAEMQYDATLLILDELAQPNPPNEFGVWYSKQAKALLQCWRPGRTCFSRFPISGFGFNRCRSFDAVITDAVITDARPTRRMNSAFGIANRLKSC